MPWQGWADDLEGRTVGGIDRIARRVEEVRAEVGADRVLLLDGGDTIGDTFLAARTKGRAVVVAVNALLAEGGHNYVPFTRGADRREHGPQHERVAAWIGRRDSVSTPPGGRITRLPGPGSQGGK